MSQYVQDTLIVCKYSKLDAISTNNEYYMIPVSTNAKNLLLMDISDISILNLYAK